MISLDDVRRFIAPLNRRVMLMIARASINVAKDATAQVTMLDGETRDDVDRMQEYGFASRPKGKSDALVVFVGGSRDHGVIVASADKRGRPALEEGEVAMWTPDVVVKITKDKNVEISGAEKILFPCDLEVTGNIKVSGDVELPSGIKLGTHKHPTAGTGAPSTPIP